MRELWDRRVAALAQVTVLDVTTPTMSKEDRHHLGKVLRAEYGEEIVITDSHGSFAMAQWMGSDIHRVTEVYFEPAPSPAALYIAPLKGDHSENVILRAVELGITDVTPLLTQHVAVKFSGDTKEKILGRWRRLAREASGQCRRTYDLVVHDPVSITAVPASVAFASLAAPPGNWDGVSAVAIGPEGGFAPGEIPDGARCVSLGSHVLRAETAGITAASFLSVLQQGGSVSLGTRSDLP